MRRIACLLSLCALVACGDDDGSGPGTPPGPYSLANAFPDLTFSRPTDIQNAGDGSNRLFVTEQTGRILVFENLPDVASASEFLDITLRVNYESFSERGLLGLAFHPQYVSNGYFFVHYSTGNSAARSARVSRFNVSAASASVADASSEKILLEWDDDYPNHNGGAMCFGSDGYLYIAIGDEGGAGDPDDNAQNRARIFGKILRIDVDQNVDASPYHGIPPDNPYVGNSSGYRQDIWAFGFRNPWRISFDAQSGLLIAGDVGQRQWEEVDIVEKGGNYGWDCREGLHVYGGAEHPRSPLCSSATVLKPPVIVYGRSDGNSITGGYIYRGSANPSLAGQYIFGDFGSGRIWALNLAAESASLLTDSAYFISTFGVAENGELFVGSYFADGAPSALYRLVAE